MRTDDGWGIEWVVAERLRQPDGQGFLPGQFLSEVYQDPGRAHLAFLEIRKHHPKAGLFRMATDLEGMI